MEKSNQTATTTTTPEIREYIAAKILPCYDAFDKGHQRDHAQYVMDTALYLASFYPFETSSASNGENNGNGIPAEIGGIEETDSRIETAHTGQMQKPLNLDIILMAAACHDLGLCEDRKTHHLVSGRIIRSNKDLTKWFTPEQIETIAQAAEDHRASSDHEPRTIYGKIIAEADRQIIPEVVIRRTIQFSLKHYPELDREGHYRRTVEHMHEKYAGGGYLKLWIPESPNAVRLEELRAIIRNEKALRAIFERLYDEVTVG